MSPLDAYLDERYGTDMRRENARAIIEDYLRWPDYAGENVPLTEAQPLNPGADAPV